MGSLILIAILKPNLLQSQQWTKLRAEAIRLFFGLMYLVRKSRSLFKICIGIQKLKE
jgi:hypothetical protein